jgi:hypothetical protein
MQALQIDMLQLTTCWLPATALRGFQIHRQLDGNLEGVIFALPSYVIKRDYLVKVMLFYAGNTLEQVILSYSFDSSFEPTSSCARLRKSEDTILSHLYKLELPTQILYRSGTWFRGAPFLATARAPLAHENSMTIFEI